MGFLEKSAWENTPKRKLSPTWMDRIPHLRFLVVVSGQDMGRRQLNHTLLSGSQTPVSDSDVAECQFSISGTFEEM